MALNKPCPFLQLLLWESQRDYKNFLQTTGEYDMIDARNQSELQQKPQAYCLIKTAGRVLSWKKDGSSI